MLHISPTNLLLLATKQKPHTKPYFLTINMEEFSGEKNPLWNDKHSFKNKNEHESGMSTMSYHDSSYFLDAQPKFI